jgi:uncharacterized protein YbaR (Trm112 family)
MDNMIDKTLLEMLVCPEDRSPLREADAATVERLNGRIEAGSLRNRAGQAVETPLDGGLIRQDGARLYPVRGGIPVLLTDEAIDLASDEA